MSEQQTSTPRIITPQEAEAWGRYEDNRTAREFMANLVHTVLTEPDRTRAAVVKALRSEADRLHGVAKMRAHNRADAIENGADY